MTVNNPSTAFSWSPPVVRYLISLTVTIVLFTSAGCHSTPPAPSVNATVGVVTVAFDLDGTKTEIQVPDVADGATLESVMRRVDSVPVELSGTGSTAFVRSIGDVKMDASRGWTFTVDGEFANQGIGQTTLHPPTTVQWSFGDFED